jgi:hypothetical protein
MNLAELNVKQGGNIEAGTIGYSKDINTNDINLGEIDGMNGGYIKLETIDINKEVHIDETSLGKLDGNIDLKMDSIVIDQNK